MRKKKPFFNRLITMTLCVSMVVTSAGIPQLRVEAAKETTDDTVQKPFGENIGYDAEQQAITVVWGNGDADGSLGYSYCVSITGQDTEKSYAKEYDDLPCAAQAFLYEGEGEGYEAGKTYLVELQTKQDGNYSEAVSSAVKIPGGDTEPDAGEEEEGQEEGSDDEEVKLPVAPSGIVAGYSDTQGYEGKISVTWGAAFGEGGTPTSWEVSIDGKLVGTETAVAAYYYDNIYEAGEHTVSVIAVNEAGKSDPGETTFTLTEAQAGVGNDEEPKPEQESESAEIVVSEQEAQAIAGNAVTLTYVASSGFDFTDYTVTVNGQSVSTENIVIGENTIQMPADLFGAEGVYKIQFAKDGYTFTPVYQSVFGALNEKNTWHLVWNDEFNGTSIDRTKWDYQTGTGAEYGVGGWGNSEEEYYTDSPENSSVGNGTLTITAKKDNSRGTNYTSARLRTVTEEISGGKAGKGTPLKIGTYGRVEAKMKMPTGNGVWPAFWMLPYDSRYGTWAASGELDILEARGRLPQDICGTIHYGDVWPNNVHNGKDYTFQDSSIAEYHIYGVEWEPTEIRWMVDGEVYGTISNWYSVAGEEGNYAFPAPFDEEFYILLNLAVGGTFDSAVSSDQIQVDENGVCMDVDYVRWYQLDEEVYKNWDIKQSDADKDTSEEAEALLKLADESGNFIKDKDFTQMNTTPYTKGGSWNIERGYWAPLLIPENGNGQATWSKVTRDGENYLKVAVANAGSQTYSSQMLQYFPVVSGYSYEISYKAYTDAAATKADVALKIGGDDDNSWAVYSGNYTDELTTTPKTYSHKFTMNADTDPTARFEFNLATSAGNVYLSDVCVKLTQINESDGEDDAKQPLSNGNHVYNGEFNAGSDGLLYWHWSGDDSKDVVSVSIGADKNRRADIKVDNAPVSIWQKGINLLQKDSYSLSFTVDTQEAQDVIITLESVDGSQTYYTETKKASAGESVISTTFTQPEGKTDTEAVLKITFAKSAALDAVKMIRTTNFNVDFDSMEIWPVYNGDFFNGKDGWNIWSEGAGYITSDVNADGKLDAQVTVGADATFYCVGIQSQSMTLDKGIKYRVKFDYEIPSEKNYKIELAGEQRDITLPAGTHTYVSEPFTGAGNSKFTLYLGPDQTATYRFLLDNVEVYIDPDSITVPEGYAKPVSLAQKVQAKAQSDVVVNYTEDPVWEAAAKTYEVDGKQIDADLVEMDAANNTLTIAGSCFPESGSYGFAAKAEGYTKTKTIPLSILEASGNLLLNGSFASGTDSWGFYYADWTAAGSFQVNEDGVAVIEHKYDGGEEWHFQLYQDGLEYMAGDYLVTFDAWSDVERPIGIQLQNGNEVLAGTANKVLLSTQKQSYKLMMKGLAAGSGIKLDFPMGSMTYNGVTAPNDGSSPYNIYLDNVVFRQVTQADIDSEPATIALAVTSQKIGQDVQVKYAEANNTWKAAKKTVSINGTAAPADKVTENEDGMILDQSLFEKTGRYEISITAAGFEPTNSVFQRITAADGDLLLDGDMSDAALQTWAVYNEDPENLSKGSIADGKFQLDYKAGYYRSDWNVWVTWSSQLKQDGILIEGGKKYILNFKASTDLKDGRDIVIEYGVTGKTAQKTVHIEEGSAYYQIELEHSDNADDFYLVYLLGPTDAKLQVEGTVLHTMTLDDISLRESSSMDAFREAKAKELAETIGEKERYSKDNYTEESWKTFQEALQAAKEVDVETADLQTILDALDALNTAADNLTLLQGLRVDAIEDQVYTGSKITPQIKVYDGSTLLGAKDYKVTYSKNVNVGTATVKVTGKGNYKGTDEVTFQILPCPMENVTAEDVYAVISSKNKVTNPKVTVKYGRLTLKNNKDYSITWPEISYDGQNTPVPGKYPVKISAKSANYTGDKQISLIVKEKDAISMSKVKVKVDPVSVAYNGEETPEPQVTVTYGSGKKAQTLVKGEDYQVSFPDGWKKIGKVTVTIAGTENSRYYGTKTASFTVTGTKLTKRQMTVTGIEASYEYTGSPIKVDDTLVVTDAAADHKMEQGTDYEVSYPKDKNCNVGKATVQITGIGAYTGSLSFSFKITPADLSKAEVTGEDKAVYTNAGAKPIYTLTYQGLTLTEGKDYKVACKNNKKIGKSAEVTISGKGNFKGTWKKTFEVTAPAEGAVIITAQDVVVPKKLNSLKTGVVLKDVVSGKALKAGSDYDKKFTYYVKEQGQERAVTTEDLKADQEIWVRVTLKGNYVSAGVVEDSFRLYTVKASTFKVDKIANQTYTGKEICPKVVVRSKSGVILEEHKDYEVRYEKNIQKGTAKVYVTGIGNGYGGTKQTSFKILPAQMKWYQSVATQMLEFFSNLVS